MVAKRLHPVNYQIIRENDFDCEKILFFSTRDFLTGNIVLLYFLSYSSWYEICFVLFSTQNISTPFTTSFWASQTLVEYKIYKI